MPHRSVGRLVAAAGIAVVMSITATVGPFTLFWTNETRLERNLVESQIESIRNVQSLLVDAESGERGYVLTGQDQFLQSYYMALSQFPAAVKTLRHSYADDPQKELEAVDRLVFHAEQRMQHLTQIVRLHREQGSDAAVAEISAGEGKALMNTVRELSADLIFDETLELAELDRRLLANLQWAVAISGVSFLISLLLGRFLYVSMRRALQHQSESAALAIQASGQLEESLAGLERRNTEIGLLAEMARLLQTELSQAETLQLASTYCQQLLPLSVGRFYLYRNSADVLLQASEWGDDAGCGSASLGPKDCWALRRGRWHLAEQPGDLRCSHYAPTADATSDLCLPLVAYGEVLGLIHIRHRGNNSQAQGDLRVAEALAEQTALALANGRMRQVLENQSIKDPLTGLYNRRFMDETLKRELARVERNDACLSVIMLDLDNFKKMNDTYGHSAGDAVLRAVAQHLLQALRASDIACRFGGEEIVVILPDCPPDGAAGRAESIRLAIEAMRITEQGQALTATASFGVASTSRCGNDQNTLLNAADAALYVAKRAGKNRVESWPVSQQLAEN